MFVQLSAAMREALLAASMTLMCVVVDAAEIRDTFSDTWAATDGLGRSVSTHPDVASPRADKFVGIFYFLWLGQHGLDGPFDIPRILEKSPNAMQDPDNPLWGPLHAPHHWGESLFGYYLTDDAYVLRKHAQMLSDAGVDTLIFDVTNNLTYKDNYMALLKVFTEVRDAGAKTPQVAFLTPFGDPTKVVKELYADLYSQGLYPDLWFRWEGKPLILADPKGFDDEIRNFFTFRKPIPGYMSGPSGPNQWGWLEVYPQHVFYSESRSANPKEEMTVGIGQNAWGEHTPSAFNEPNTRGRSWHNNAKDTSPDAVNYGFNVAEQWSRALEVDPMFIFFTGWNEWIAGRFGEFNGVKLPVMFVDEFTQEYSRDIEPMKGGHEDAYYYQFVDYVRRFKGARLQPRITSRYSIMIDGDFDDWSGVTPSFLDDIRDEAKRDHAGWGAAGRYVNATGRNDIIECKVADDGRNLCFYVKTRDALTTSTDRAWMWLFIDSDRNHATGWEGYDFIVNRAPAHAETTSIERASGGWKWRAEAEVPCRVGEREIELAIPRNLLTTNETVSFEFKWMDNMQNEGDIMDFITNGDAAPNGRFNYVATTGG